MRQSHKWISQKNYLCSVFHILLVLDFFRPVYLYFLLSQVQYYSHGDTYTREQHILPCWLATSTHMRKDHATLGLSPWQLPGHILPCWLATSTYMRKDHATLGLSPWQLPGLRVIHPIGIRLAIRAFYNNFLSAG